MEKKQETYSLPLYDSPLKFWGFAADFATSEEEVSTNDETRGEPTDSLTLTLREFDSGKDSIEAVHSREGEPVNHYQFNVVDRRLQTCASADHNTDIPWFVRRGLTRFGYYDRTTPASDRRFAFDHLLTAISLIDDCVNDDDVILRGWVNHVIAELATSAFFISLENQLPYAEFKQVLNIYRDNIQNLPWWHPEADYDSFAFDDIYDQVELETPVFLPRVDWDVYGVPGTEDGNTTSPSNHQQDSSEESTHLEFSTGEEYIFAAHISRYAIDRYQFNPLDDSQLILEYDSVPDLPPYLVLRHLQQYGYEVVNVPTLSKSDSLSELIKTADELMRWVIKRYDFQYDETLAAYSGYLSRVDKAFGLALMKEQEKELYLHHREELMGSLGLSKADVTRLSDNGEALEQLTASFLPTFDHETFADAEQELKQLRIPERYEKLQQRAKEQGFSIE